MTQLNDKNIMFIGGGNIAQALITGLLGKGLSPTQITVSEPNADTRQYFQQKNITTIDPQDETAVHAAIQQANILVLAVKPQVMPSVISSFGHILKEQLVISIAAGLDTAALSKMLGGYQTIIRAMPNTPAMIQMGATGLYASDHITPSQKDLAYELMSASGLVLWVEQESLLHAVTAVSGSAPAYFFYMLESMIEGAMSLGLSKKQASALAMQTALGSAQMSIVSDDEPAQLRKKVTSPNGTTQAAIELMQDKDVSRHIQDAMKACYERSIELSKGSS